MNKVKIRSTGNILLDAAYSVGLFELLCRIDPSLDYELTLGSQTLAVIRGSWDVDALNNCINEIKKDEIVRERLNFQINIGRKLNAYEHFKNLANQLGKIEDLEPSSPSKGVKSEDKKLLPMSVMPIYGKGLRGWDDKAKGESARVRALTVFLYFLGLAYYTIQFTAAIGDLRERNHVLFIPPIGVVVKQDYLTAMRRISGIFTTQEGRRLKRNLGFVPIRTLPLLLFTLIDLATFSYLFKLPPQLLIFSLERKGRGGEGSRKFEAFSTHAITKFLYEMDEQAHSFKSFLRELAQLASRNEFKSEAVRILMEFSEAIKYRRSDLLNLALYRAMILRSERQFFMPDRDCLTKAAFILTSK